MKSQFDLTRFYDVIIRNSLFKLGLLTREFQIPLTISYFYLMKFIWPLSLLYKTKDLELLANYSFRRVLILFSFLL